MKPSTIGENLPSSKPLDPYELVWVQLSSIDFLFRLLLSQEAFDVPEFSEDLERLERELQIFIDKYEGRGLF